MIIELKEKREALWEKLNALVAQDVYSRAEEKAFRDQIREIQQKLAILETEAFIKMYEAKIALGEDVENNKEALERNKKKLELLK